MIASKEAVKELRDLVLVIVDLPILELVEVNLRLGEQVQEEVIVVVHFLKVVPEVTC